MTVTQARFAAAPGVASGDCVHWSTWSACSAARVDPDWWFARSIAQQRTAAHICVTHCPVLAQCLAEAERPRGGVLAGQRWTDDVPPVLDFHQPIPSALGCPYCMEGS